MTDTMMNTASPASLMLTTTLNALMTTLTTVSPFLKGTGTVGTIISVIGEVLPIVVKEAQDLAPIISNIISVLRDDAEITPDQLAALDAFEAVIDADFDDAAAMALANDAAVAAAAKVKAAATA